jgi:hypothetical protein
VKALRDLRRVAGVEAIWSIMTGIFDSVPGPGVQLELVPVLLQRHTDQLTSRSDAGLGEELL